MNKIYKLLLKLIFLCIPFILVTFWYQNSKEWKNKYGLNKFNAVPNEIKVANLGSSHGGSFFYGVEEFQNLTTFNFSIPQQTLDFDYAILKQFIDSFSEDSILFICISPFETNGKPDYNFNNDGKQRYYSFLKPEYFEFFSIKDWFVFNHLALFSSPHPIKDIKKLCLSLISKEVISSVTSSDIEINSYENKSKEEKLSLANLLVIGWKNLFPASNEGKTFNLSYIDRMIDICKKHNIHPIIITPPISKDAYDALVTDNYYYNLYEFYNDLAVKYPDVKLLNYIDLYFDREVLFKDNNHLNLTGAKEFSKKIYSDLEKFGYISGN